jgi:hypothetical protein
MTKRSFITLSRMESIAENILNQAGYSFSSEDGVISAVPIDEIIEFQYNLEMSWEVIDHFSPDGVVMAAIIPTKRKIIMNDSCKELYEEKIGTMHFTMAHELGHWVLHVADKLNQQTALAFDEVEDIYYCRSASQKHPEEFQADMFAGCLLMPRTTLTSKVTSLKSDYKQIQFRQLYKICDTFKVSISALKVRLHQLNLLYIDKEGTIYNSKEDYEGQTALNI